MKAILEFELPEDEGAFRIAVDAGAMRSALWDISQILRQLRKYRDDVDQKTVEKIETAFYDTLAQHRIDINEE